MADVLTTVLELIGGGAYVRQIQQAAQAHKQLAVAQAQQAAAQRAVQAAMAGGSAVSAQTQALAGGAGLPGSFAGIPGGAVAAGVAAGAIALKDSTQAFASYEQEIIRTQTFLRNMGRSFPTAELQNFARDMAYATGSTQTEIISLTGYLARFGTDASTMKRATRDIVDASQLTGKGILDIAHGLEAARKGHAREFFKELGINIRGVEGQLYSTNQLLDILERHTHGGANAFFGSMQREINQVNTALEDMKIQAGQTFSSPVKTWLQGVAGLFKSTAAELKQLRQGDWAGFIRGVPLKELAGGGGGGGGNGLGGPGRAPSEEYLRRIEQNTGPQGALGRALRAGGSYGEPGGGLRIRDFNLQMRHGS